MIYLILKMWPDSERLDVWFKLTRLSDGYMFNGIIFVPEGEYKIGMTDEDFPGIYEYYSENVDVEDGFYGIDYYYTYYRNNYMDTHSEIVRASGGSLYMLLVYDEYYFFDKFKSCMRR